MTSPLDNLSRIQNRECGDCTMCCKILSVTELEKPANVWCSHAKPGIGCGIHAAKPHECTTFRCLWLNGVGDDSMKPSKSGVILTITEDNTGMIAHVDQHKPDAWRRGATGKMLLAMMQRGVDVVIACGKSKRLLKMQGAA